MDNIKDLLGCRCHGGLSRHFAGPVTSDKTPAHTFPWATHQYPPDRPVWPVSQSLDLVVDIEKNELSGSNTIAFKVLVPDVGSFEFDAVDLHIHDVKVNGHAVKFDTGERTTTVYLAKKMHRGDTGTLKITYSVQNPKSGIYFIKPDAGYPDRPTEVWTQGQDDDARCWFPTFDEPRIKCALEVKVEVPAGYIATSNGALHSESRGGKTWTFSWKSAALIPSYLVTLTVGKFSEIKDDWRGKPVRYLVEKGREDEAKLSFGKTPKMLELFSKTIGVDYPYEKYDQIAVAEFIFGGMENTSSTTQTDTTLHPAHVEEDYSSDDLVSHELAHQWFGDLVTCKTWSHGWLNEGWATFMEQVFKENDMGRDEVEYYRYEDFCLYEAEDKIYRRPVVTNYYSDPGEVWDRHLYQKGGLVLNLLRHEIGDEDFWAGTRNYLNAYRGTTVETVDFQRCLEAASGRSFQRFFDQWIYGGGYPELKASFSWDDKGRYASFTVTQKQKTDQLTPVFALNTEAEFVMGDGSPVKLPISLEKAEQTYVLQLKEKPAYIRFDVGNHIPKTLEWALPQEMLLAQLSKDTDVMGKVWAMKQLSKEGSRQGVEALVDRLKNDGFWAVRGEAALALGETKTEEAMKALIAALAEEKRSRARQKICEALGQFRDEKAAEALIHALEKDPSDFVRGQAAAALGKTKSPRAFESLKAALNTKSFQGVVAAFSYTGLKNLRDSRALDLFIAGAQYGQPPRARLTAVTALGEYGLNRPDVQEFLEEALRDKNHRVRFAAADALVRRKNPGALPAIEEAAHAIPEGHFKAAAFRAAKRLRDAFDRPQELVDLKESFDKLADENRKLQDRLSRLEQMKR